MGGSDVTLVYCELRSWVPFLVQNGDAERGHYIGR